MAFNPKNYAVLLAGPRISRLRPFFESNGYAPTAFEDGETAIEELNSTLYHLVCLELDLGDIESHEFLSSVKSIQPNAAVMMIEDAVKSHMIVSSMVRGVDVYVPTPPDEKQLFDQCRRHCLAAAARGGGTGTRTQQLETELQNSRNMLETTGRKMRVLKDDLRQKESALEEAQSHLSEAETDARKLKEELATAKADLKEAKKSPPPSSGAGAGTGDIDVEALQAQADFVAFLESENDELKKERDSLLRRLRELGGDAADDFDEPTGESVLSGSMGTGGSGEDEVIFSVEDSDEDNALADVDLSSAEDAPEVAESVESPRAADHPAVGAAGISEEPTAALQVQSSKPSGPRKGATGASDEIDDDEIAAILAEAALDSSEDGLPFATSSGEQDDGRSVPPELLAAASDESEALPAQLVVRDLHDMISTKPTDKRSPPVPRRAARAAEPKVATLGDARETLGSLMGEAGFGEPAVDLPDEGTEMTSAGADMLKVQASMNDMMASMQDLDDFDLPLGENTVTNASSDSSPASGRSGALESRTAAFSMPQAADSVMDRGTALTETRALEQAEQDELQDIASEADGFLDEATEARPMVAADMLVPPPIMSGETRTQVIPKVTAPIERGAPLMSEAPFDDDGGFEIDIETNAGEG